MAVYTEISEADLATFVAAYDIGPIHSLIGIAEGVENTNYLLLTDQDRYILTLYEKRVRADDLPFFLDLTTHLADRGVLCPRPLRANKSSGDALFGTLRGKPAAIVTFLNGVWPRRVFPDHCRALGQSLAALHIAGQDYARARANDLSLESWRVLGASIGARANDVMAGLADEIADELHGLAAVWPRDLPAGIIHADLFPDNVFFDGKEISGIIDFYFSCNDFFAYDLAICLNAWCFEPDGAFNITKARYLLAAYRKGRSLTTAELEALPLLCRGSALRFLLTRLHDWLNPPDGALVRPKDPLEYLRKLRFHRAVSGPGDYGLD